MSCEKKHSSRFLRSTSAQPASAWRPQLQGNRDRRLFMGRRIADIAPRGNGAAGSGEPAARVAAVEVALHELLDDRPEKPVLPLETTLILRQEPVEMMEEYPVENGPLRMSGTIDSRYAGCPKTGRVLLA